MELWNLCCLFVYALSIPKKNWEICQGRSLALYARASSWAILR